MTMPVPMPMRVSPSVLWLAGLLFLCGSGTLVGVAWEHAEDNAGHALDTEPASADRFVESGDDAAAHASIDRRDLVSSVAVPL